MKDSQLSHCRKMKQLLQCMHHHTSKCVSSSGQQMYKHVLQFASTPALIRCFAEPEMCQCGRCLTLVFTNLAQNPLLSQDQICM